MPMKNARMREKAAPAAMPKALMIVDQLIGARASATEMPALTYKGLPRLRNRPVVQQAFDASWIFTSITPGRPTWISF
ncbi:hypothetical protein SB748_25555 [Rhizobium sp. SIMBA_035]